MELFYNPERMSETEIKETFVAHQWLVDEIVSILKRQPKGAGVQHVVIVAPRGMGKTTLLLMLRFAVLNTEIAKRWQPVLFPEESYSVYDLADLWVEFLNHIASETGDAGLRDEVDGLKVSHPGSDDLEAVALAKIKDWRKTNKKRLVMLLDNFDMILEQIGDEKDNASLRDVLMNDDTLMLVGGSTTFFKEARAYDQPLYNLFKIYNLDGLDSDQIEDLLRRRAKLDGVENFEEILSANRSRLRVLEYFTGGNPRLVLMLYRVITHSEISDVRRGLEKLLDEVTPYYKAKIEALPPQQRKILDQIARITGQTREGLTPTEIAPATRLPINHVSAQLKRLADVGYVRIANIRGRSSYYTLSEPLYAIWHQMRFSREARKRMNWMIEFLKVWYDAKELGTECQRLADLFRRHLTAGREAEARDALEHRRYLMEAIDDNSSRARTLDNIVLSYLELKDVETLKREVLTDRDFDLLSTDTRSELLTAGLFKKTAVPFDTLKWNGSAQQARVDADLDLAQKAWNNGNHKECMRILTELENRIPPESNLFLFLRAYNALVAQRIDEALSNLEVLLERDPNTAEVWDLKSIALMNASRLEEATQALKRKIELKPDFNSWWELANTFAVLGKHEEAVSTFDTALQFEPESFGVLHGRARSQAELGRTAEALDCMDRALLLRPASAKGWHDRAVLLMRSGDTNEALKSFDRAIALEPTSYESIIARGWCLSEVGETEATLRSANRALELSPDSSDAHYLRGLSLISSDAEESLNSFNCAFDAKSKSNRNFVETSEGKSAKVVLSTLNEDLDQARSDWQELIRHLSEQSDKTILLKSASDVVTSVARVGHWELAYELITSSNLEEPLFPLARALHYLLNDDQTSIEKLSPEVKRIVEEIVSFLEKTSANNARLQSEFKSTTLHPGVRKGKK